MKKRLLWKFDLLLYRLFYWRWNPRLRRDPDLAYLFSKVGSAWANGNPPHDPEAMDALIVETFAKHGKNTTGTGANIYLAIPPLR